MFSATYLKGTVWGTFANSLPGRDDFYLHNYIYNEDPTLGELRGGILLKDAYTPDGSPNTYYINPNNWYLADRDLIQELIVLRCFLCQTPRSGYILFSAQYAS